MRFGCNQTVSDFSYVDVRPGGADGFWARERVLAHFFTSIGVSSECNNNRICARSWQVSILNWTMALIVGLWESSCWMCTSVLVLLPYVWVFLFFAWNFFPHMCQAAYYLLPWISWLLCPFPAVWPSAHCCFWRWSCSSAPSSSEFLAFFLLLSSSVEGSFLPCSYTALSHLVSLLHYTHLRKEPG